MLRCTRAIGSFLCKPRLAINLQMTARQFIASDSTERGALCYSLDVMAAWSRDWPHHPCNPHFTRSMIYYLQHCDVEF